MHFQNKPFTKRQIKKIEKEAKEALDKITSDIAHKIDKQILNDMMANGMIPSAV